MHQLLGGAVRDRVRVYGWVGGDEPDEVADHIAQQVEAGLTAVKMNASGRMSPSGSVAELDGVVARVAAAREVLGDHGTWPSTSTAASASPTPVGWPRSSSPTGRSSSRSRWSPENSHLIAAVRPVDDEPVSTGERLYSRQEFLPVLQAGVAVVQPDLSHAGGITEVRKIAALAETFDAALAPHCPLGPLALAASLQVAFATPNHLIQEQSIGIHYNQGADVLDYLVDVAPLAFVDGHIERLTGPARDRDRRGGGPGRRQGRPRLARSRLAPRPTARSRSGDGPVSAPARRADRHGDHPGHVGRRPRSPPAGSSSRRASGSSR